MNNSKVDLIGNGVISDKFYTLPVYSMFAAILNLRIMHMKELFS